jgi:hypothetical protein
MVTVTSARPVACAPVTAVRLVDPATTMPAAATPPTVTVAPATKP